VKIAFLVICLTALPGRSETPAQAPAAPSSPAAQSPDAISLVAAPTKQKPYLIEGKMTVTTNAPTYSSANARGEGALLKEGLAGSTSSKGDSGPDMSSNRSYAIQVPPKAKLMVQLKCRRLRNFRVHFVSESMGRTEDPGLFVNRLHHRDDAAFYENKTAQVKTIHCILVGVEPMTEEPFTLVFTDY